MTTSIVVWKVIKPNKLNSSAMNAALEKGMAEQAQEIRTDMLETLFGTWNPQPDVIVLLDTKPSGPELFVGTDDKRVRFVEEGTAVRYATMSPDFEPKSQPAVLQSFVGKGRVLFVNKSRPRPGIKGRHRMKLFQKKRMPLFKRRMEQAMREAAKESGHAI